MRHPDAPALAGRREWIGLAVIALPCLLYSMDLTVLNLAVPALSADLEPSSAQLLWIVDIYGFLVAGSLITMGTLGDRIGRRRLLLIGAAAFGVASVLAAFSTSAAMLIAARALLGVAGATLAPSTLSLIRNMFLDPRQRTIAIGVWITSFSAGGAIGPLIGGVVLEYFWWGSVFLIDVPVMVLLLVLGPAAAARVPRPAGRPARPAPARRCRLAAVLAVIYGLKRLAEDGLGWLALLCILAGVALGIAVRAPAAAAGRSADRPARCSARRPSAPRWRSTCWASSWLFGLPVRRAVSAAGAGHVARWRPALWTLPSALGLRRRLAWWRRGSAAGFGRRRLMAGGLALVGARLRACSARSAAQSALAVVVAGSVIFSLGLTPVVHPDDRPGGRRRAAGARRRGVGHLGNQLRIRRRARHRGPRQRRRGGLPRHGCWRPCPRDWRPMRRRPHAEPLGGAVALAGELAPATGEALLAAARAAFVQGLQLSAAISAVVLLAACVLALVALRHVKPAAHETPPTDLKGQTC